MGNDVGQKAAEAEAVHEFVTEDGGVINEDELPQGVSEPGHSVMPDPS